jgi:hypothetical protein
MTGSDGTLPEAGGSAPLERAKADIERLTACRLPFCQTEARDRRPSAIQEFAPDPRIDTGGSEDPAPEGAGDAGAQDVLTGEDKARYRSFCLQRTAENAVGRDIYPVTAAVMMSGDRGSGQWC